METKIRESYSSDAVFEMPPYRRMTKMISDFIRKHKIVIVGIPADRDMYSEISGTRIPK